MVLCNTFGDAFADAPTRGTFLAFMMAASMVCNISIRLHAHNTINSFRMANEEAVLY